MQPKREVHTPIIDTHLHLWDMKQFRPPWLNEAAEVKIRKPCTLVEYQDETKGLNILKAVYMEIDINPEKQVEEADWISAICHSGKTKVVKAVVSGRPADPKFKAYAKRYRNDSAITGFRQVLQVPDAKPGLCLTPTFVDNVRYLGSIGKTFDFCIRPGELRDAMALAQLCPDTRFVLDHCGNAAARNPNQGAWESDIRAFAKIPNVICKISGIIKTVKPDWDTEHELFHIVRHVYHSFGPDRVMFGGDWPVCNKTKSMQDWVATLDRILVDKSPAELAKFYHGNAAKFYGIPLPEDAA